MLFLDILLVHFFFFRCLAFIKAGLFITLFLTIDAILLLLLIILVIIADFLIFFIVIVRRKTFHGFYIV